MGVAPNHPTLDHCSIESHGDLGIPPLNLFENMAPLNIQWGDPQITINE